MAQEFDKDSIDALRRAIKLTKNLNLSPVGGRGPGAESDTCIGRLVAKDDDDAWKASWKEVSRKDDGTYEDMPAGLSGTTTENFATERNKSENYVADTDEGDVVKLRREVFIDDGGNISFCWVWDEGGGGDGGFWVRITGSSPIADNPNRYVYTGIRQKTYTSGKFQDADAVTISPIYNSVEAYNDDSGVQGNSIDLSALAADSVVKPIQGSPVLWCRRATDCFDALEYFVQYENAVTEGCQS